MKMKTTYLTILTVMLLVVMQISCSTKKPTALGTGDIPTVASAQNAKDGSITTEVANSTDPKDDPYSDSIDVPISYPEMELSPPFDIIKSTFNERTDQAESLYVLIPKVDLSKRKYATYVKNIVKKLVVYDGYSETISVLIFDDKDSLEKMFLNPADPDLNIPSHFIARYDGNKKGLTYQYHLEIFPFAPKSNPYVVKHHDVIQFNPFNW
jgi:hypothetical protein